MRILTRGPRPSADGITHLTGDLLADEGVEAAVAGARTVLHLAGPRRYDLAVLSRPYLDLRGRRRRPTLPVRIPGKAGRAYRAGANLALEGAQTGKRTWEDFLAEQLG